MRPFLSPATRELPKRETFDDYASEAAIDRFRTSRTVRNADRTVRNERSRAARRVDAHEPDLSRRTGCHTGAPPGPQDTAPGSGAAGHHDRRPASRPRPSDKAAVTAVSVPADAGPVALREAAEAGDTKALFELGSRYADGRGVKQDMGQASIWYEKSAELGFAPAQYRIGNLYEKALGVERDITRAKTWYQLAAEQGNASAMHNLAVLYAMGADGTPDNQSAARWFRSAADLGVKDSQFNLGILAAKGVGMPRSLEESYKWFALAAKSGDSDAASKRDEIANALTPDQLMQAKAAVELWKSAPVDPEANSVEIPEILASGRRRNGRNRHEEGGRQHPADPQQERLRRRRRRRRDGRNDQVRDHGVPEGQRHDAKWTSR